MLELCHEQRQKAHQSCIEIILLPVIGNIPCTCTMHTVRQHGRVFVAAMLDQVLGECGLNE